MGIFSKKEKNFKAVGADFAPQLQAIKREIIKQENGNHEKVEDVDSQNITRDSNNNKLSSSPNSSPLLRSGSGNGYGNSYGNGNHSIPSNLKATVISQGFSFKGEIAGEGALNIDGAFSGKIDVDSLSISSSGSVDGEIKANTVKVTGQLVGVVDCIDLTLADKARVEGRVTYESIQIQKGSMFRGEIIKKK
jgi:cytoskeletal protein CcmA (bactofilin family)